MVGYIEAGWIAFDSTRRRVRGARLIPVAVERNNGQIMPVRGSYAGEPEDCIAVSVDVDVRGLGSTSTGHDGRAATDEASQKEG